MTERLLLYVFLPELPLFAADWSTYAKHPDL